MDRLLLFFGVAVALAAVLANISIWTPRRVWIKVTALTVSALFLPAAYLSLSDLLSRPKPVAIEWAQRELPEAAVLSAKMEEDVAIYLWLAIDGLDEPRAYRLPWSQQLAQQLQDAQRSAQQQGTGVRMRKPFETSLDDREQVFYAPPQQMPPEKQRPTGSPLIFQKSRSGGSG